jgi:hypothetical protein
MKNLNLQVGLRTLFFSMLIALFALNPVLGVVGLTGSAAVLATSKGMATSGIDLTQLNTVLGAYMRKYAADIWRLALNDIELEKYMRKVPGVSDEYVQPSSSHTEFLQPYQKDWTPKGTVAFDAMINKVRQIKMDLQLEELDELHRSYLAYMATEEFTRDKWPIVKYIVINHVIPGIRQEIATISAIGKYQAPTPGTAGSYLDSTDGILTVTANQIADGGIVPLTTGVLTDADILEQVDSFYQQLPKPYRSMPGDIIVAPEVTFMYDRAYWEKYNASPMITSDINAITIRGTRKRLVAIPEFEGSQRMIHTTKNNMLCMFDKIEVPGTFETQVDKRIVNILTDFKRGYGYGNLKEVFVNDVDGLVDGGEGAGEA